MKDINIPLDDGLTPLLGHESRPDIQLPERKLCVLGAMLGLSVFVDAAVSSFCCTAAFSQSWLHRLGLGNGAYPFGSAGLDLAILALLRPVLVASACLAFYAAFKRANFAKPESEHQPPNAVNQIDTGASSCNGIVGASHGLSPLPAWRDPHGLQQGANPITMMRDGVTINGNDGGCAVDRCQGQGREHSYEVPRRAKWLESIAPAACSLSLLLLVAKCLTRLVAGPGSGEEGGLRTSWFWAAIGWSIAASAAEFRVAAGFTATCRRYWFLHCCRERGDLESALQEEEAGGQGGTGDKKNSGYSATFGDVLMLCVEDWKLIAAAAVALVLAALSQVLIPHFTGNMIDNVVESGDSAQFRKSTIYLVLASASCAIFSGIRGGIFSIVGARVNVRVRQRLFSSLVKQEIGFFDTTKTGDLTSRLASDCTKVGDQVTLNVNVFLRNTVMVVVTLLFMFYLSWRLSLVAFISVPLIVVISKWYGLYIRKLSKLSQDKLAEAGSVAEESLGSMPTVRSFAAEDREEKEYAKSLQDFYVLSVKGAYAYGFYACSYILLPNLVTAAVLYYGGILVLQGSITGGKVVSFMIYLTTLSDGFNDMANIFSSMTQAVGAADKVFELIRREPKGAISPHQPSSSSGHSSIPVSQTEPPPALSTVLSSGVSTATPDVCQGEVELKGVDFEYPSRPGRRILDGVSFSADAGQVLALVGPSGGGKSSCIALLENLYQPSRGQVMLDGAPVHHYDHRWLHRSISIVGQEPTLYARSIRENIIYGLEDDEPTMAEVEEAARLANAHTFISQLPNKYETQAGERGVQMSGGQKQRIAIARALVRKPKVLLLDEATSALDAESEHLVQQAIDNMISRGGMTVILIAHRLNTVKRADKIVVIKGGKVAEQGTHEELLSSSEGVYAGLVKRQIDVGHTGGKQDLGRSTPRPSSTAAGKKSSP